MAGVDLTGKIAIVTGGYSGIGLATVRDLHKAGATVILPARNVSATREIFKDCSSGLEISFMDLLAPDSIDDFAGRFVASGRPLHLLINNAGIMASPLARDKRGFESQFATNHLGHFQLTIRLWEALKRANAARVINLSSLGHRYSDINYDDPNFETTLNSNPGVNMKSIEQGAATTLFCATSSLLKNIGGVHCEDSNIAVVVDASADRAAMNKGVLPYAVDQDNAARLWDLSRKLTGLTLE